MHHPFTEEMELKKMEIAHHHEDDHLKVLYEASYRGCVSTLSSLIQQDPLILNKINSRTVFIETPLHISASLGHSEFTKALLSHEPNLALELDSFRSTALHIASAEGHIDIVKKLLAYDQVVQACIFSDREGRIPLHYGVIRGRLEVVRELVRANPGSLRIPHKGKSVFHLCVEYNHLEILNALVELDIIDTSDLLDSQDLDGGNTILHLAIMFKQVETVRYLLSIPKIREASNLENDMGFTASDIVERIPKDIKSLEIQILLMNNDIKSGKKQMDTRPHAPMTFDVVEEVPKEKWWRKIFKKIDNWLKRKGNYLEEMRGNLSLVATVISTMIFQVALNPPGSYIQQSISNPKNDTTDAGVVDDEGRGPLSCYKFEIESSMTKHACPGEAMLASRNPNGFLIFMIYNTISFISSLAVTLLLVSGVPLKGRVVMWILTIGMWIALSSLALAYLNALNMMTPDSLWDSTDKIFSLVIYIWIGLLGLIVFYTVVNFLVWAVKKCMKIVKHLMS